MNTPEPTQEAKPLPPKMEVLTVQDIGANVQSLFNRLARYSGSKSSNGEVYASRGISCAITKLEEAEMYLQKELALREAHNQMVEALTEARKPQGLAELTSELSKEPILTGNIPAVINGSN